MYTQDVEVKALFSVPLSPHNYLLMINYSNSTTTYLDSPLCGHEYLVCNHESPLRDHLGNLHDSFISSLGPNPRL